MIDPTAVSSEEHTKQHRDMLALGVARDQAALKGLDILATRREAIRKKVARTYMLFTTFVILLIVAFCGYVYYELSKPGTRYTDYRSCTYLDEKVGIELTGQRRFSYMEKSLFGIQFRQSKDTLEQTELNVNGSSMTIVGMSEGSWYSSYVGVGEKGIEKLKPSELYIVTMGSKVAVFEYQQFCK